MKLFSDNDFIVGIWASCRMMERIRPCLDLIMDTRLMKVIKRIFPLANASWMMVDIILDLHQTLTYYYLIDGFSIGGEYHNWAVQYKEETNGTELITIFPGYFHTACAVWTIPPVLLSFDGFVNGRLQFPEVFKAIFRSNIDINENRKNWFIFYPQVLIGCILSIYVVVPYAALKYGLKHLMNGEVDEEEPLIMRINPKFLPFAKLFEIIGEALPQFILTLVFTCNNYPFLNEFDTYFSIPIPTSIISLVFSLGSLIIGVISGCKHGLM